MLIFPSVIPIIESTWDDGMLWEFLFGVGKTSNMGP